MRAVWLALLLGLRVAGALQHVTTGARALGLAPIRSLSSAPRRFAPRNVLVRLGSTVDGKVADTPRSSTAASAATATADDSSILLPPPSKDPSKSPWGAMKNKLAIVILLVKLAVIRVRLFSQAVTSSISRSFSNSPVGKTKLGKGIIRLGAFVGHRRVWPRLVLLFLSWAVFFKYIKTTRPKITEVSYASFLKLLEKHPDKLTALRLSGPTLTFLYAGQKVLTRIVQTDGFLMSKLITSGIDFAAVPQQLNLLGLVSTCLYLLFLWMISTRMTNGPQDEGAGKRRERNNNFGSLSFAEVAGQERAMGEVREVCEMLKSPSKYAAVGARVPAGVLLVGPPGTGKTLLARVAAAEAGVPFFACSATDFVEVFVGRGPARVRNLFQEAALNAPCIVFIDEIDSVGRPRSRSGFNQEQENTLNQLLTSMDGLDTSNNGVIVIAATNRYELLDPALTRAGRFDRVVQCPLPDKEGRRAILAVHTKRLKLALDVDLERIARMTPGTCGADLAALVNEAAIRTARRGGNAVSEEDLEDAVRSFVLGRGVSLSGLAESMLPNWLSGREGGKEKPQPAPL